MRKINRPKCPNPTALLRNYKHRDNKQALMMASNGKCMYCESKISSTYFGDIEHIKPKKHFPELEYVWTNLGYSCAICNNNKKDKFDKNNPFINPYEDDPSNFLIAFGVLLFSKKGSEIGELTISGIDLNRGPLVERRYERLKDINKLINACFRTSIPSLRENALNDLQKERLDDKEFSFFIDSLLKNQGI